MSAQRSIVLGGGAFAGLALALALREGPWRRCRRDRGRSGACHAAEPRPACHRHRRRLIEPLVLGAKHPTPPPKASRKPTKKAKRRPYCSLLWQNKKSLFESYLRFFGARCSFGGIHSTLHTRRMGASSASNRSLSVLATEPSRFASQPRDLSGVADEAWRAEHLIFEAWPWGCRLKNPVTTIHKELRVWCSHVAIQAEHRRTL